MGAFYSPEAMKFKLDGAAHASNPIKVKRVNCFEFEPSLSYTVSARIA